MEQVLDNDRIERDHSLNDEEGCERLSAINNDQLKTNNIEADPCKITREVAEEINVDHSVVGYFHLIEKPKKRDKRVPHAIERNKKNTPLRSLLCPFAQKKQQFYHCNV